MSQQHQEPAWPELLGSGHWSTLLDPLSLDLRRLLLRAGDLCQVTYDSFNTDQHSKYCGSCRYSPAKLLKAVEFPEAENLHVARYLYATSSSDGIPADFLLFSMSREAWSKESNWIGYVAVSNDDVARVTGRREVYVAWRGTIRSLEWVDVLMPELVSVHRTLLAGVKDADEEKLKVMKGWHTIYTSSDPKSEFNVDSARDQLLATLKELVDKYKGEKLSIIFCGHSLGASLAILSAFDVVANGLSKVNDENIPVCAFVFGCPQVGNKEFKEKLDSFPNLRILHVKHSIDLIPLYPSGLLGYAFTGVELVLDCKKSPYLKDSKTPGDWHNLQGILHSLAGYNGKDGKFEFRVKRSIPLVNKSSEYLKDELLVPGSWWVEKNKGMVLDEDGDWRLAPPADEDIPVPPGAQKKVGQEEEKENGAKVVESGSKAGLTSICSCFRAAN